MTESQEKNRDVSRVASLKCPKDVFLSICSVETDGGLTVHLHVILTSIFSAFNVLMYFFMISIHVHPLTMFIHMGVSEHGVYPKRKLCIVAVNKNIKNRV